MKLPWTKPTSDASSVAWRTLEQLLVSRLQGVSLLITTVAVWLAGATYCHGYERLLTGLDGWPGSLAWSAAAVLPWFALFEWSKSKRGIPLLTRPAALTLALVGTGAASILLETIANALTGSHDAPIGLDLMRGFPRSRWLSC